MLTNKQVDAEKTKSFQDVTRIISSLDKNIRSKKLYADNNPVLKKHQEDLLVLLNTYLQMNNDLHLLVDAFEMKMQDQVVYENDNRQESFSFKLYNDGIRSLTFKPGITDAELEDFLKAFVQSQKKENEEAFTDTVAALWEKEFEHIKYSVADTIVDEISPAGDKPMDQKMEEILDQSMNAYTGPGETSKDEDEDFYQTMNVTINPVSVGKMFQTHTVLSENDLQKIRQDITECERPERMLIDFVDMVLAVLMEETQKDSFNTFINYLGQALESTLIQNQFHLSRIFMELVYRFPTKPIPMFRADPNTMQDILKALWQPHRLQLLLLGINQTPEEGLEDIEMLIGMMDPTSASTLIQALSTITDINKKRAVCRGIVRIAGADHFQLIMPFLTNKEDPEQVRIGLYMLSLLKGDRVVDAVSKLLQNQQSGIKKEIMVLLKKFPGSKTNQILLGTLKDSDLEIRLFALKILGMVGDASVAKQLASIIPTQEFQELSLNERKAYFIAVAKLAGNDFLPYLEGIFEKKNWFSNQTVNELYICAAFGLSNIRTDQGKALLNKIQASGNKFINQALQVAFKMSQETRSV